MDIAILMGPELDDLVAGICRKFSSHVCHFQLFVLGNCSIISHLFI